MKISDAIPLNHPLDGYPEYCCSDEHHNYHFRPGARKTPGDLIWCCCKSVLSEIKPEAERPDLKVVDWPDRGAAQDGP